MGSKASSQNLLDSIPIHSNNGLGVLVDDEPDEKQSTLEKIKKRVIRLPSCIKGAKPGVIRNDKYFEREAETRRRVSTASTTKIAKEREHYGMGGFIVLPVYCKFGVVKAGQTYESHVTLTNVGIDATLFRIKKPSDPSLTVTYKVGPVMYSNLGGSRNECQAFGVFYRTCCHGSLENRR